MSGTSIGGKKAAAANILRHGAGFYARIGQKGGRLGHDGGFFATAQLPCECGALVPHKNKAACAGARGGHVSKRRPKREQVSAN